MTTKKRKQRIPPARDLVVKPSTYQPSKAELNETQDMPGMTKRQIRNTFFRPFNIIEKG